MSRQAQAEREKQARVILGSAEAAIAGKFVEAASIYAGHPWALQLRAMNCGVCRTDRHAWPVSILSICRSAASQSSASCVRQDPRCWDMKYAA